MSGKGLLPVDPQVDPLAAGERAAQVGTASIGDSALLARAAAGDADAACELLRRHGPAVRRRLAGRIPRRWRSLLSEDDVMQQTYADALAGLARFAQRDDGSLEAWLWCLARCNLRDAERMLEAEKRGGRRRRIEPEDSPDGCMDLCSELCAVGLTPSRQVAREELRTLLEQAIAQLPPIYRDVVRLYDLHGEDIDAVCLAVGRRRGAVYMLRARAHDRLRELLGSTNRFFSDTVDVAQPLERR